MAPSRDLEGPPRPARLWIRSVLAPPLWSRWLAAGVAGVALVAAADLALGAHAALASALAIVALIVGLGGGRGDAIAVAAVAVLVAAIGGLSNGWRGPDTVGLVVVVAGSAIAVLVALVRATAIATGRQLRLLRKLLALSAGEPEVETLVDRLLALLVPALADLGALELVVDGQQRRLGSRAAGPDRGVDVPAAAAAAARAMATGTPELLDPAGPATAGEPLRSALCMPLATRGAPFGVMVLGVGPSGRRYTSADLDFAELVAGRVAIVLDNAGLTRAAAQTERRMIAALDSLEEAVTMNGPGGETVYVNDAAIRLLAAESPEELYRTRPGEISERFAVHDEAGRPVDFRDLPAFKALAGEDHPPAMLVRNVVLATGEERWLVNKVSVLRNADGEVDRVVNVIEDVTEVKQAERRQRLLSEATRALSGSLDYERTLQRVAEVAVPALADWCSVDVPERAGLIEPVAIAHTDPDKVALGRELRERYPVRLDSPTELARIVREGGSHLMPSVADADLVGFAVDDEHLRLLRGVGFGSTLIVPLMAGGRSLGALTLVRSDPRRQFSEADRRVAEELGQRAGIAVLNAHLYTERTTIARELQAGLLPPELPALPGLQAASLYRPAGELNDVGGDFYDVFPTPAGWMAVIGDVAGQGARAAALTALARFTLRSAAQITGDPLAAAEQVNRTLRDQPEMSLVTIAILHLHDDGGGLALSSVSCGHPLPVLVRDATARQLGRPGPLAGAFDDAEWPLTTTPLEDGDTVVLYTDGVLDTVGAADRFGQERLLGLLAARAPGPQALVDRIDAALRDFQSGPHDDDTAIVALTVRDRAALAEFNAASARPAAGRRPPRHPGGAAPAPTRP